MTKQEFLNKLSHEELLLVRDMISYSDVAEVIRNRALSEKKFNVEVGNCFVYQVNQDELYLIKIEADEHDNYFTCNEISIYDYEIDYDESSYHINDFSYGWEPLDPSIYEKVVTLIKTRDTTVKDIVTQFDKQIRELCSTLLNTQNKN